MRVNKWAVFAVALGMMVATAGWLHGIRGHQLMGPPGVKVGPVAIYDDKTNLLSTQSVVLPTDLPGIRSKALPITTTVAKALPQDTTYGRRYYWSTGLDFGAQLSVVLMGTDHTSIHQPQYCLYAQDWTVTNTERINLRMDRPFAYDIPAIKMTATRQYKPGKMINCLYVYWFVSGDKITAEEGSRLWSMWKTVLRKGELERWAYISYFVPCVPGREQEAFESLEKLIKATVPEFQLVTGNPPGGLQPMAAQK